MRWDKLLFGLLSFLAFQVDAQELYKVGYRFKVEGATEGEKVLLAYHLGGKQYVKDSMFANAAGEFSYKADTLHVGLYMITFPSMGNQYFELIVNEKSFSVSTNKEDFVKKMRFTGSQENAIFYSYLNFLQNLKSESESVETSTTLSDEAKQAELNKINEKVENKQAEIIGNFSNMMIGKLIKANKMPELKKAPEGMAADKVRAYQFYPYRAAFLAGIDLSTSHLLYTPIWEQRMGTYLDRLTVKSPDSAIKSVDYIMSLANKNDEVKQFTAAYLLNKYATDKTVCYDKVYVHIAEKYYANGQAPWVEKTQLEKILINAKSLKPVLCGVEAPNIILPNEKGIKCNMHQLEAKRTLLVFWNSTCGHCKETIEQLIQLTDTSNLEVEIVTVSTDENKEEWLAFVNSHKMSKWTNLGNYNHDVNLLESYYLQNTPQIYLLDESKVIQYKRVSVDQLYSILTE